MRCLCGHDGKTLLPSDHTGEQSRGSCKLCKCTKFIEPPKMSYPILFRDTKTTAVGRYLLRVQLPVRQRELMAIYGQGFYGRSDVALHRYVDLGHYAKSQIQVRLKTKTVTEPAYSWALGTPEQYVAMLTPSQHQAAFTFCERAMLGLSDLREGGRFKTLPEEWSWWASLLR